jgi:hypothetical protein
MLNFALKSMNSQKQNAYKQDRQYFSRTIRIS